MYHNCKNTSKILTAKNESASEYAFPTFIPISLIFYNKRNPKYEVPVTRVTKEQRITY